MQNSPDTNDAIEKVLGLEKTSRKRKNRLRLLSVVVIAALLLSGWLILGSNNKSAVHYTTAQAIKGPLTITVTATGELKPLNQVDVGTEVSGTVKSVAADYNDRVARGQILAELDTAKLNAQVLQSEAALQSARANRLQARAAASEAKSNLTRMERARDLSGGKVPSRYDLDAAGAALKKAVANEAMAQAQIAQAVAALDAYRSDMDKAVIRAPISGVILTRSVEPGQTVAASLQTPVLFTMAEDLTVMELHVGVDEADVGQVVQGQQAVFTVDAYPDKTFPAVITQVRFASQTENGVVTYETLLAVNNPDLLLRPGMTATAEITVKQINDVVLIPNAALRFTPPVSEKKTNMPSRGLIGSLFPRPGRMSEKPEPVSGEKKNRVWTLDSGNVLTPVFLSTGPTDGIKTQVVSDNIQPGLVLVTDQTAVEK